MRSRVELPRQKIGFNLIKKLMCSGYFGKFDQTENLSIDYENNKLKNSKAIDRQCPFYFYSRFPERVVIRKFLDVKIRRV